MEIQFVLNGKKTSADAAPGAMLYGLLREKGCYSVKCGRETTNCGLCTVWVDGVPTLSCAMPVARVEGREVTTMEGLQKEAEEFGSFLADRRGGTVWFLLTGIYYECTGDGAGIR